MNQQSDAQTLSALLNETVARRLDAPAVSSLSGSSYTYRQLGRGTRGVAEWLSRRGVSKGDRVALFAENCPEWSIWYLGTVSIGAVIVPILTDFHPRQVSAILDHSEPVLIVCGEKLQGRVESPKVDVVDVVFPQEITDYVAGEDNQHVVDDVPEPDDLATIIYTSGTTGNPKGVMLSHWNLVFNARGAVQMVPIHPEDHFLSILPLAHSYEWTIGFLTPLVGGARVTYLGGPPTITKLLAAFQSVQPTMVLSVPLILEKIYRSRVAPIFRKLPEWLASRSFIRKFIHRVAVKKLVKQFGGRLRFFGVGGAALSPATERFLSEGRFPYAVGYGLTETSPLLAGAGVDETRFRSTGPALSGVSLRIDRETPESVEGEIQAQGPNVMQGYYKNPEATAAVYTPDGWFKTGDLGVLDEDGYLFIRGRAKSVIVGPSGENIYPEEIEAELDADPLVAESLVVASGGTLLARVRLNLEALGEQIGEFAQNIDLDTLRKPAEAALDSIRKSVNKRLNQFSRLSRVILQTEEFERTPTKKIKRFLYQDDDTPSDPKES